jgi:anti-sigma-K factor RskA
MEKQRHVFWAGRTTRKRSPDREEAFANDCPRGAGHLTMREEHVTEQLPAYALGILEIDEQAAVAEHVAACPICQGELASYQAISGDLATLVPPVEPPPALRARLRQTVGDAPAGPQQVPPVPLAAQRALAARTWFDALRDWLAGPIWRPLALALLVVLALGLFLSPRQATAPGIDGIHLTGTDAAPDAYAIVVLGSHYNRRIGTLIADHLEPLGPDQQYQLWLIEDGERLDGGVFDVGDDGYGSLTVRAPEPLDTYAFGVTVEPAGGSPGPTGPKVLGTEP